MIILNFSHPLTSRQTEAIEADMQMRITRLIDVRCQFDNSAEFEPQIRQLVGGIDLSSPQWQSQHVLIVPPGYAPATSVLLAELHGRMGHFPSLVRIRPAQNGPEPFEVAEVIRLRTVRDNARQTRHQ